MDQPQRLVALRDVGHDDAERHDVGKLLERDVLVLHLAPDRIGRLLASGDLGDKAALLEGLDQLGLDLGHQLLAALAQIVLARSTESGRRVSSRRQLFQLALDPLHADARGKRRVEVHGLVRDAPAPAPGP